ncbi:MAG: hypothetical protein ABIY37_10275 [Devosia sp.]
MCDEELSEEIIEVVERIEGIVFLDLASVGGTWREHIKEIYVELQRIRLICGDPDAIVTGDGS